MIHQSSSKFMRFTLSTVLIAVFIGWFAFNVGASPQAAPTSIVYVNQAATGANNGSSWADAYTSLNDALATLQAGDEVWVAAGLYVPSEPNSFNLVNGTALYGGFNGTESTREARNPTTNVTILSGDSGGDDVRQISEQESDIVGSNLSPIISATDINQETILDGVTLTAAQGPSLRYTGSNLRVQNVTFAGNFHGSNGGGIHNNGGSIHISNSQFINNGAARGAGLYSENSGQVEVVNTLFQNNKGLNNGAAINIGGGSATLINVRFLGNNADGEGGAVTTDAADVTMTNVLFVGNTANFGGAMSNVNGNEIIITNATFVANQATSNGGAMYTYNTSPTLRNSILWNNGDNDAISGNTQEISHSLIEGQALTENGNLDGTNPANAPRFIHNPNVAGGNYGNLRPLADSPIVNQGLNSHLPADSLDLDSNNNTAELLPYDLAMAARINDAVVDLGAYEYTIPFSLFLPLVMADN